MHPPVTAVSQFRRLVERDLLHKSLDKLIFPQHPLTVSKRDIPPYKSHGFIRALLRADKFTPRARNIVLVERRRNKPGA